MDSSLENIGLSEYLTKLFDSLPPDVQDMFDLEEISFVVFAGEDFGLKFEAVVNIEDKLRVSMLVTDYIKKHPVIELCSKQLIM
jgi:hypothetical protein